MAYLNEEVRKAEKLSKKEAARLEKLIEEIEEANPSMPPEIYQPDETVEVDTDQGGQSIDGDVLGAEQMKELKVLIERFDDASRTEKDEIGKEITEIIGMYLEGGPRSKLYSIEIKSGGWIAHLSMPGYMDQTEPQRYDTLKKAVEELHGQYASE